MGMGNLAVRLAAVAVPWLGLMGLTIEAKASILELNPAIAAQPPVHFTPDANLVPSQQVTVSPLSQDRMPPLAAHPALLPGNSSILPGVPPTPSGAPLSGTGISQQANDLLPMAPAPARLIAQTKSPQSDTEIAPASSDAATETTGLAREAQNPIANLISFPLQNNWNFGVGPESGTQYVLNIQPVIPLPLGLDWMVITR